MYINQIDDLFDKIINNFYIFNEKKSIIKNFSDDTNFVKYQTKIIDSIEKFYNKIDKKRISKIIDNKNMEFILNIIKRYCAFYLFFGISYYYKGDRDLFITNLVEFSRDQKMSTFQISNFFNSENNYKIIKFFTIIKQIIQLKEYKSIDRIKIILKNKPILYQDTINFFEELGEDYIIDNFLIKDNFHNIIKTIIFKKIYINEEKDILIKILNEKESKNSIYKYIQVVVSNKDKLVDFNVLHTYFSLIKKQELSNEFYNYINKIRDENLFSQKKKSEFVDFLFSYKKIIPISDDFLRYHKSSEKYNISEESSRDSTKIKYIINRTNKVINLYSDIYKKNAKMKLEVENNIFFKQMRDRNVIIYNDDEEIKIINKLELSDQTSDIDLLVDLENFRKYPYLNFKDFENYGFRIRPSKTIQSVRYINFKSTNKKKYIETRIGNKNIPLNVVGIILNPNDIPLECFKIENLVDVRKLYSNKNGFASFIKLLQDSEIKSKKVLYYWTFDVKNDKINLDKYLNVSSLDNQKNINIMLEAIYENYKNIIEKRFLNTIKKNKDLSLWNINNTINLFRKKFINLELDSSLKNNINYQSFKNIKKVKVIEDEVDNIIPGKGGTIIKLPKVNKPTNKENIILVSKNKKEIFIDNDKKNFPICLHYIKWNKIKGMKSNNEYKSQAIYDFVKHYVKQNKRGDYVCKSCNEIISNLKKYVHEGTYIKELDTFMTTSLAVNQNLNEIPKYSKYTRTIRNIEKNIEKICYYMGLNSYLGNTPIIKLNRKLIIKDTIDLILIHTDYLKSQPKDRRNKSEKKYNINKDLTRLFFFPLKDDIFLTSSEDIDQFKIIKFNNVITYIVFILISEMKPGQILNMKNDKLCNYFIYSKIGKNIMQDLYIRYSEKDKKRLEKIPLLSYIIFNISCIITNNHLWLWSNKDKKKGYNFLIQKVVINTIVDLFNSVMEASFQKNKNFLYEIITTRLKTKIDKLFNDENINKIIKKSSMDKIRIDSNTKKIKFVTKKMIDININDKIEKYDYNKYNKECNTILKKIAIKENIKLNPNIDILTNCPSGKFHKWKFYKSDLVCNLCNQNYNKLFKEISNSSEKDNNKILDNIRYNTISKLTKTYCLDGKVHDINKENNICKLCKLNPYTYKFTKNDLMTLEKNLSNNKKKEINKYINKIKKNKINIENREQKYKKIMNQFLIDYKNDTQNNINNYISDFCDKLVKILAEKIKVKNQDIFIKNTIYIISNNHYGNDSKKIFIKKSDEKIIFEKNHPFFKTDVLYFKDKNKRISVYYNAVTKQYIGYAENYKIYKKNESYKSIEIKYSIKDMLLLLGLKNEYTNINDLYESSKNNNNNLKKNELLEKIIRNRNKNLKFIINLFNRLIFSIKYNYRNFGFYNLEQKNIIQEFNKLLKNFKSENDELTFFDNKNIILERIKLNKLPDNINLDFSNNFIKNSIVNNLDNSDNKLIYYTLKNFEILLNINKQPAIKSNIAYLIVKLIKYTFEENYLPLENTNLRKFMTILNTNNPDIDNMYKTKGIYQEIYRKEEIDDNPDSVKQFGIYNELLTNDEINSDERNEQNLDTREAFDSLDIDDYGSGDERNQDDIDYNAEAF
jgi:hypothetical protein